MSEDDIEQEQKVTNKNYYMNSNLVSNLNSIIYNVADDWDFIILITGSGKTRTGKSCIAQQIAYFLSNNLNTPFTLDDNIVFDGDGLIKKALKLPKNSVIIYDEARAELEAKKSLMMTQNYLYDFFAECGMLNHIIILVMPCFFELQKRVAINRSICLINVIYERQIKSAKISGKDQDIIQFKRGKFRFYNERRKKLLYMKGIRSYDNYDIVKPNFTGSFKNKFMVNKKLYEERKMEFLKRQRRSSYRGMETMRDALLYYLNRELKVKYKDISKALKKHKIKIDRYTLGEYVNNYLDSNKVRGEGQ